jgi:uncharacterized RDD family membrane protein YckC
MATCSACGYEVIPGNNLCTNCGVNYDTAPAQVSPDAASDTAAAAAFSGQPAAAAAINTYEPAAEVATAPPEAATPQYQAGQTATEGQPQPVPGPAYGHYASSQQPPGQFPAGPLAPPGWPAAGQDARVSMAAVAVSRPPALVGPGITQAATACPKCGQAWTGSQSCTFCGQVWGLPNGIVLSSAGRRLGGFLLDGLLIACTLVIGWIVWTLIVWTQGQTPAKQLLGMRVVRLDTRTHAGWGRMFLRDFVGKLIVAVIGSLIPFIGNVVADCWLLWDKDKQELWDKIAGTVVVNDPDRSLAPSAAGA